MLSIVRIYFNNVRTPHPETLRDALLLRDNASVDEWRRQISSWTNELNASKINLKDIKEKIDEANGYIEGAGFLTKTLSVFEPWMMLPLGVVAALATDLHALHFLGLGVEALRWVGKGMEKSVAEPDRLKHRWLMLSTNNPGSRYE